MPNIIPAILVKDADTLRARLALVEGLVDTVQLDCMDGHFVENRTWYESSPIDASLSIELHLMVSDPLAVIENWKRSEHIIRAIWHVEIPTDHEKIITRCRELGWECGLALSPETPIDRLSALANEVDEILVLGVTPGWSGQKLIQSTLEKADQIKERWPDIMVGFDGGVTQENLSEVQSHTIDRLNIASAIFEAADPRETLRAILSTI
jgi:ribulose-phosphate 3-epimerase